jgi:hypothetical protein
LTPGSRGGKPAPARSRPTMSAMSASKPPAGDGWAAAGAARVAVVGVTTRPSNCRGDVEERPEPDAYSVSMGTLTHWWHRDRRSWAKAVRGDRAARSAPIRCGRRGQREARDTAPFDASERAHSGSRR